MLGFFWLLNPWYKVSYWQNSFQNTSIITHLQEKSGLSGFLRVINEMGGA